MRHVNYTLKPATIYSAKPREKAFALTDGGGLLLEVLPSGSRVWRYKYHLAGKREKVTIGSYPEFTIKQARDKHEAMRALVERGESPAKTKQALASAKKVAAARSVTFRTFAQSWVADTLFYRSEGYRAQTVRWLDAYVYPEIGDVEIGNVQPAQVLAIIEKRVGTAVTAERIRTIIQQVFNHAIRKLLITSNPATPMRGIVTRPPVKNHRHLSEKELAAFWRALSKQGAHATTTLATRLLFWTMARKCELLRSTWPEFDLDGAQWDIPGDRMKNGKPHRVFLSTQAVAAMRQVRELTGHGSYVFPSIFRGGVPMGDVTLNHFFKRIDFGVPEFSPHGTRGTAATILREHGFSRDVVELLLAHNERSATVAAYTHAEHVLERKRAMQFLADLIERLTSDADEISLQAA